MHPSRGTQYAAVHGDFSTTSTDDVFTSHSVRFSSNPTNLKEPVCFKGTERLSAQYGVQ